MTDIVFAIPALWLPFGAAQRLILLSTVKSITLPAGVQGLYLQSLSQNVRVTLDGTTNPVASGNDIGFVLRSTDPAFLFTGQPGMKLLLIQEAASAVVQYQLLTLSGRYS